MKLSTVSAWGPTLSREALLCVFSSSYTWDPRTCGALRHTRTALVLSQRGVRGRWTTWLPLKTRTHSECFNKLKLHYVVRSFLSFNNPFTNHLKSSRAWQSFAFYHFQIFFLCSTLILLDNIIFIYLSLQSWRQVNELSVTKLCWDSHNLKTTSQHVQVLQHSFICSGVVCLQACRDLLAAVYSVEDLTWW